ncbi:methyltransferase domain-containing protein [Bizionia sp. KMM 8389]
MDLSESFWDNRYQNQDIGWDLGHVSRPLKAYFDQLEDKGLTILIPGAGNAYEAEYLFNKGFTRVFIVDLSQTALDAFQARVPNFPSANLLHSDFFDVSRNFDLIIEQTFFCALNPSLRKAYAEKIHCLLNPKGKLVGLLFNKPLFTDKPPFGGDKTEYVANFNPYFNLETFELCYNSEPSRNGKELFIICSKK